MYKRCLLLLLTFTTIFCGNAQEFPIRHYTMRDGLLHSTVYRIYQDKRGFIWLCTDYGISKFNGKDFVSYTKEDGLSDKTILSVSENQKGHKLVATYKGGITLITDTSVSQWSVQYGKIPDKIAYTIPDGNKTWLMYFAKGSKLGMVENDSFKNIPITYKGQPVNVFNLYKIPTGILVSTSGGIYKVDNNKQVTEFLPEFFRGVNVSDMAFDNQGGYWVGTTGASIHVSKYGVADHYKYAGATSDILVDRNNNTWIATENGEVFLFRGGTMENITSRLNIANIVITDIFEDREGNIWMGTQGLGVYMIMSLEIMHFFASSGKINMYCNAIEEISPEEIWSCSFGTVSALKKGEMYKIPSSLKPAEFTYFIRKHKNHVYIGTPTRLIRKSIYPPYTEEVIPAPHGAIAYCYKENEILIGGFNDLFRLEGNKMVKYDTSGFLENRRTQWLTYDNEGTLWISTDTGTITYKQKTFSNVTVPGFRHPFKTGRILMDSKKRMWFSTENGLICKTGDKYRVFTKKDGLISSTCRELFEDDENRLWVSTYRGINVIDLNNLNISEFVIDMDISEIISLYKKDNTLLIGTIDGLSVVNTRSQISKSHKLPVYITSVTDGSGKSISMPSTVQLPYGNNKLLIDFAGLCYRYPHRVEYRYKMAGLDDEWHITKNNTVEMSTLPNGVYDFVLSARLNQGDWSDNTILSIKVETPVYKEWWFIVLTIFVLIGGSYIVMKRSAVRTENKKREKLMMLNKVIYSKQQALSALINPHFIFNCMNSIQHYMNVKNHELANAYLADFASLIRMTLENAQEVFISLEKEIKRLELYLSLEQLRMGEKLQFKIDVAPDLDVAEIRIPNMILQPFVENAIWHGIKPKKGQGEVTVTFLPENSNQLKILIKDNGVGIKKNNEKRDGHRSFGVKLITERLDLLGKLLNEEYYISIRPLNEVEERTGTIVEIILSRFVNITGISKLEKELNASVF